MVQLANARGEDVHGITLIAPGFAPTNGEPPMMKLPPARPALVAGAWVSPPLSMAYFKSFVVERGQDAVREYGVEKLAQMYNVNGSVVKHVPLHV